jgi:hypothetical protein
MKAYKVELLILNFDNLSEEEIKDEIENVNYANDCIAPAVMKIVGKEIGEWYDDHPFNRKDTAKTEYDKLFENAQ